MTEMVQFQLHGVPRVVLSAGAGAGALKVVDWGQCFGLRRGKVLETAMDAEYCECTNVPDLTTVSMGSSVLHVFTAKREIPKEEKRAREARSRGRCRGSRGGGRRW